MIKLYDNGVPRLHKVEYFRDGRTVRSETTDNRPLVASMGGSDGSLSRVEQVLAAIQTHLGVVKQETTMARADFEAALTELKARVTANTDINNAAVELIKGIASQLDNASGDPAAIKEITNALTQQADALAQAIQLNADPNAPVINPLGRR